MQNKNILISACLIGENVRYDGKNNLIDLNPLKGYNLIPFCPEVEGGLPTPRVPSEIMGTQVINKIGKDLSREFQKGAQKALQLCKIHNIQVAILKANSPSCSNSFIYDGTFSKNLVKGKGITAKLLEENGIKVFNEFEIDNALKYIKTTLQTRG